MAENFQDLSGEQQEADSGFFSELGSKAQAANGWPEYQAKQQAAMIALMKGGDIENDYERVLNNLTVGGGDEDVDAVRSQGLLELRNIDGALAEQIVASKELAPTTKIALITDLSEATDSIPTPQVRDVYIDERAINAATSSPVEERTHNVFMNNIEDVKASNTEIENLVKSQATKFSTNAGEVFVDFLAAGFAPGFGFKLKGIIDDILPEEGSVFNNLAPGEALVEFRRIMQDASPGKRVEIAKQVIKASEEMAGLVWENDYEQYTFLTELLGDLNPSEAEIQTDRWLNNLFGILDIVPGAVAAVRGSMSIFKTLKRGNVITTTSQAAPRNAAETVRAALDDVSDATVNAAGTTREELVTTLAMPKPKGAGVDIPVGPDINATLARPRNETSGINSSMNYTANERAAARDNATSRIEELANIGSVELLSKTQVAPIDGGISARTVVGPSDSYGWSSVDELRDAVDDFLEVTEGATVDILKRDNATGSFIPAKEADLANDGEFLAQINVEHIYNPDDVLAEGFSGAVEGVSGFFAKYLNKTSVFSRWVNLAGNVAAENRAAIKADLIETMKPFNDLSGGGQSKVMAALDEGDQWVNPTTGEHTGKWFSQNELVDKFDGDERLIRGYQAVREHQERIYELQNTVLRRRLTSADFKQVTNEETGFTTAAKRVDRGELEAGRLTVFDPKANSTTDLAAESIDELYEQGGFLARMPQSERYDDVLSDLVLVRPGAGTKLTVLPDYVLKKREGYITKIYDTTHLVKKKLTGVRRNGQLVKADPRMTFNGRPMKDGEILVTMKMANNPVAAARAARQLGRNAAPGEEFGVVRARELDDMEYGNQTSYEFFSDRGQLFFSRRGEEVESVTGERTLKNIADSIEIARNNAAKHAGMDDILESMTRRWEKRYGRQFGEGPEGKFPVRGEIKEPRDATGSVKQDRLDAIAIRDHINMLAGIDTTTSRRNFTRMNIWVAEKLAGMGEGRLLGLNEKLSETILRSRDRNILDVGKSLAFIKFIVLNPARQLVLQSQQASVMLGLDYGFKYFASGKGVKDWVGLTAGLAAIDRPNVWRVLAPQAAKGMGMTVKEYKELVQTFRKTGIPDSIDSHAFVQIMALDPRAKVSSSALGQVATHLQAGMDSSLRLARKVGFDAGEYTNLSAAWLAVRNKWIKNNPGKDWRQADNLAQITGETRAVTFNMSAAGTLQQQKGLAGLMFQFMSHATKSIQVLIPDTRLTRKLAIGKLADRAFSNREKLRIGLTQLAIYGSGGLGLNGVYNKARDELGIDVPNEVNQAIEEGLAGYTLSGLFGAIADEPGEDTSLAFSASFGPFSGTPQATPLHKILPELADAAMMQSPDFRMLAPAALSAIHQVGETIKTVNFILNGVDLPDDAPNKWLVAAEQALTVASGYDNILQARVAAQVGQFVTRNGNPTVQAAGGEILARATLGIRAKREQQVGDLLRKVSGTSATLSEGLNRRIDGYARDYANLVMKVFRQVQVQGDTIPIEAFDALEPHITAMKLGLNEGEFFFFKQRLQERLFRDLDRNKSSRLSNEITRLIGQGIEIGGPITTKIRNMEPFKGQEELVNLFNVLEGKAPVTQEEE